MLGFLKREAKGKEGVVGRNEEGMREGRRKQRMRIREHRAAESQERLDPKIELQVAYYITLNFKVREPFQLELEPSLNSMTALQSA